VANPILESRWYRSDIAEARTLRSLLVSNFFKEDVIRQMITGAQLDPNAVVLNGSPSANWAVTLNFAAGQLKLDALLTSVEDNMPQRRQDVRDAIAAVRQVTEATGASARTRLLLSGNRPFLGRTNLREHVGELRNWQPGASILVVRGDRDSGRTETQNLVDDGIDPQREIFVFVDELRTFESTLKKIWSDSGVTGSLRSITEDALTTESAALMDFWDEVKRALDSKDRFLWVLFDDLDKGEGRVAVRTLAEVLAIQLRDVSYQRRFRLVMLGYPMPQLPSKVKAGLVRNDKTDNASDIDLAHVRAFIEYCVTAAGKTVADPAAAANAIWKEAKDNTKDDVPYLQALNEALSGWLTNKDR
jgi:hypothetical protein